MTVNANKACRFERNDSQYGSIAVGNKVNLDFSADFTFQFWWLPDSLGVQWQLIRNYSATDGYAVYIMADNKLYYRIEDGNALTYGISNAAVATTTSHPVHITLKWDASEPDMYMFVNGESVADTESGEAATSIGASGQTAWFGSNQGIAEFADGLIDEFRGYDVMVSNNNIKAHYLCSFTANEIATTGLQILTQCEDNLLDSTANSNDWTNNNSITFENFNLEDCYPPPPAPPAPPVEVLYSKDISVITKSGVTRDGLFKITKYHFPALIVIIITIIILPFLKRILIEFLIRIRKK